MKKRQFTQTRVILTPAVVEIDIDMEAIAKASPRITLKDLVVIANAMGGRILMAQPAKDLGLRMEIKVTE